MKYKINFFAIITIFLIQNAISQTVDLGSFKGKPFKLGGGISAGSTYFKSDRAGGREPFVYNFTGNVNVSFYSFSMPISYNFTNLGGTLNYQIPFNFNRLSLNPRYKWISAYIGDASMTFSPYSLAGHQFTGGGLELTPNSPFKFSAMYGRFLKAVEEDGNPNSIPSYERWGYGSKIDFIKNKYKIGLIGFFAQDLENSIKPVSSSKNITPKQNLVVGLTFESQITNNLKLYGDYSNSSLVQDTRTTGEGSKNGLAALLLNGNASTQNFSAYKVGFDFKIQKTVLGTSFERVDPNYQTLGAYFFANDLQNIMVNVARPLFRDKVTLTFNAGVQRDNLDNKKAQTTNRFVGTLNTNVKISERFTTAVSLSNQTTTSNVNPDQFIKINQVNPELNQVEQLNYRQLSRNASVNANYSFAENKKTKRSLSFNYAFNQVANEQGGVIRLGQLSAFHNFNTVYSHFLVKSKWAFNTSLNYTYNTIGILDNQTIGPVIGVNKKFFKDKLTTQFASAYNTTRGGNTQAQNFNFRLTSNYKLFDEHHFNLMISQVMGQNKITSVTAPVSTQFQDLTITFGYNFNFAGTKKKETQENSKKQPISSLEKEKLKVNIQNTTQEYDSKSIKISLSEQLEKINPKYLEEEVAVLQTKKDTIFTYLDVFDNEKDESVKSKLKTKIAKEVADLSQKITQMNTFNTYFEQSLAQAITKVRNDITSRQIPFKAEAFVKRYNLNSELASKTDNDLELFETEIIQKEVKISKKDIFVLANIDLENTMETDRFESSFNEISNATKADYYKKFISGNPLKNLEEQLEVNYLQVHLKQYVKKIKQKM